MSRGEFVYTSMWADPKFEALTLEAGMLYIWSFTNPRCNMAGLYEVSERTMLESKVSKAKLPKALAELREWNLVFYHDAVIWVRRRVKRLHTKGRNIGRAITRDVDAIDAAHPLRVAFLAEYGDLDWLAEHLEPLNVGPDTLEARKALDREIRKTLPRVSGDSSKSSIAVQCSAEGTTTTPREQVTIAPELRVFVGPVHATLARVAKAKPGAIEPTEDAVARTLARFPDRDFLPTVEDMEHWLIHGTGRNRSVRDVVQTYANQLKRQAPVARKTQPGGKQAVPVDLTERRLREARGEA